MFYPHLIPHLLSIDSYSNSVELQKVNFWPTTSMSNEIGIGDLNKKESISKYIFFNFIDEYLNEAIA